MDFKPTDYIALTAVLSSLIIAIFTLYINRKSVLEAAHKQTISPMRLKRIEDIRDALAQFVSLVYSNGMGRKLGFNYSDNEKKELMLKTTETNIKLKLLLTKNKETHQNLANKLDEWIVIGTIKDDDEFSLKINLFEEEILNLSQLIFEDQWEKIKN